MKQISHAQTARISYELFCESAKDTRITNASPTRRTNIALGVLDGKRVCLGFVMEIINGTLANIQTLQFDTPLTLSAESFERLWNALAARKPAAALLCTRAMFEGLERAENKLSYLTAVGHTQSYFYRVELQN